MSYDVLQMNYSFLSQKNKKKIIKFNSTLHGSTINQTFLNNPAMASTTTNPDPQICKNIPNLLSTFVDTFVDFTVSGGIFLPNLKNPNPNPPIQTHYPPQDRLIAIGDIHGDLEKCKQSFRLANIIDAADNWSGKTSTVVQVGDILDRGNEEIKILYFLEKLKRQAENSGGKLITMNGNHEIMNINGDFRFAMERGVKEFLDWAFWYRIGISMKKLCHGVSDIAKDPFIGVPKEFSGTRAEFHEGFRARLAALRPGGPISTRFLAENATVVVVGENVFVHGGLLANHVKYGLERINNEVREWIRGERRSLWKEVERATDSVVWLRKFSHEVAENCDCEALDRVLGMIPGCKRMIMGHTIQQEGVNSACGGKAIRIDVGMSKGCGNGFAEVLEFEKGGGLRVLTSNPVFNGSRSVRSRGRDGLAVVLEEDRRKQVQVRA
ncbi:shewanella-like protein phosphatase 2 [Silene latifolia]|uniref:shewanella-like protein phosphatase 2 n=1 Tax=Silene latifolia TaxID=37657 RepID=UPI003D780749